MATCLVGARQLSWSRAPVGLHVGQFLSGGLGSPSLFRALLCPPGARVQAHLCPHPILGQEPPPFIVPAGRQAGIKARGGVQAGPEPGGGSPRRLPHNALASRKQWRTVWTPKPTDLPGYHGSPGEWCPLCVSPQVSEGSTGCRETTELHETRRLLCEHLLCGSRWGVGRGVQSQRSEKPEPASQEHCLTADLANS